MADANGTPTPPRTPEQQVADKGASDKPTRTPEQQDADKLAFDEFHRILKLLVAGTQGIIQPAASSVGADLARKATESQDRTGDSKKPASAKDDARSARNPFVWWNRFKNKEPEFEKLIAKYINLLPTLDREDGRPYSHTALAGLEALKRRNLEIAKTVYSEVPFKTTASANLFPTILGVLSSFVVFLVLGISLIIILAQKIVPDLPADQLELLTQLIQLGVAFCFGCFGSVVSFLGRLSDFDKAQERSQRYLLAYGLALPIIGGGFALVVAAGLCAGFITLFNNKVPVFIVVGFLAGFSEQFTYAILKKIQNIVSPEEANAAAKPQDTSTAAKPQDTSVPL